MVPRTVERQFDELVERFTDRAREVFSQHYYADVAELALSGDSENCPPGDIEN